MNLLIYANFTGMKITITPEIQFRTARSGGKGGQNVNKVETMVEGRWHVDSSVRVTPEQKLLIHQRLANRIHQDGCLLVKSQTARSQWMNKQEVIEKMNKMVVKALLQQTIRKATQPTPASKEKRLETKKRTALNKVLRKKVNRDE
jgi:ribosome-associated protein